MGGYPDFLRWIWGWWSAAEAPEGFVDGVRVVVPPPVLRVQVPPPVLAISVPPPSAG